MTRRVRLSAAEARRIALSAQGFDRARPQSASDTRHFRRAMAHIGVLQLDFVNVLLPAHFLIIWSRLGPYGRGKFEHYLYESGEFTEQWAHEASIVSTSDWPLLAHRRREYQPWINSPIRNLRGSEKYLANILKQVRQSGPITAQELPPLETPKRKPGDWHKSMPRRALEMHFGAGELGVSRRLSNFQRVYDLSERLIHGENLSSRWCKADAQRELLRRASQFLGIATSPDLADYYRMSPRDAAPRIAELVEDGALHEIAVDGWSQPAYLARDATIPRKIGGASLLSPFDPVVWFRPRLKRLFDFEYRIEIYVPAAERRWGYYVLPFRVGDRIVARVDLKADRKRSKLLLQNAYLEATAEMEKTAAALAGELRILAEWLKLDDVITVSANAFSRALALRI